MGVAAGFTALSASAKLLELDDALLAQLLAPGGALHLKGGAGDALVLTTSSATYSVLTVETSNSLFVCRPGGGSGDGVPLALEVQAKLGGVMQLARLAPSTRRLRQLLLRFGPYAGPRTGTEEESGGDDALAPAAAPAAAAPAAAAAAAEAPELLSDAAGAGSLSLPPAMDMSQYGEQFGLEQYGRTQRLGGGGGGDEEEEEEDEEAADGADGCRERDDMDASGGGGGGGATVSGRKRPAADGGGGGVDRESGGEERGGAGRRAQRRRRTAAASRGSVDDTAAARGGYTYAQLVGLVPCSEAELQAGLVALGALRVDVDQGEGAGEGGGEGAVGARGRGGGGGEGVYRLLDEAYAAAVLDAALAEAEAAGGAATGGGPAFAASVDVAAVAAGVEYRFPPAVTAHVLHGVSTSGYPADPEGGAAARGATQTQQQPPPPEAQPARVCLDFKRVALRKGVALLQRAAAAAAAAARGPAAAAATDGGLPVPLFMAQWARALPAAMVTGFCASGAEEGAEDAAAPSRAAAAPVEAALSSGGGGDRPPHAGYLCLSLLAGHALLEAPPSTAAGAPPTLRYFSHVDMEDEPPARFGQLFAARTRWTEGACMRGAALEVAAARCEEGGPAAHASLPEPATVPPPHAASPAALACPSPAAEITPFIAPLAGPSRKVADMLLAHARSTLNPDGTRFFSRR